MAAHTIQEAIRDIHILQDPNEVMNTIHVGIRAVFLRVGELDTQTEKFQAHIAIEAQWFLRCDDEIKDISSDDQTRLNQGEIVKLPQDFAQNHWHPHLFLLNVGEDSHEEIKYSMKKSASRIQIREFRDVYGNFYSKFDLHHFPTDIQELSISIGSALFDTEVTLEADRIRASGINREAFVDQQEWRLYDHIETRTRFVRGFLFQNDDDNELDTPGHERKRSILTIACHAARRADYFFWNGYCLIFLITIIAFSSFAIPANGIQFRVAITCTLLLTSIAFRWTISNALPNISYLTVIDLYAIVSILVLIILCAWHSIIGTIIFVNGQYKDLSPDSYWTWLDRKVFCVLAALYIVVHLVMGIWHYIVPIAQRKRMRKLDQRYRKIIDENISHENLGERSKLNSIDDIV